MDRENVISGLHCRAQDLMIDLPACDKCDYQVQIVNRMGCDFRRLCKDAIALLKEQEAVEPIPPADESDMWRCGNCHHQIFRCTFQRFCEVCGREVKWE